MNLYTDQFNLNQFNKIALLNFSAPKAITVTGGAAKEGKTSHALQRGMDYQEGRMLHNHPAEPGIHLAVKMKIEVQKLNL